MRRGGDFLGKTLQFIQLGQFVAGLFPRAAPEYEQPPLQNTDPMEGFAAGAELEQYRHGAGRFYLGRAHPDHGQDFEIGIGDDRHIFLVAGNASGKGRSILMQNGLRWRGGLVSVDPKGELAAHCAMWRGTREGAKGSATRVQKFMGQENIILDPFDQCAGPCRIYKTTYNPLVDVDISSPFYQGQIKKIAEGSIVPEQGDSAHFSDNAETLVAGVIEAVMFTQPKRSHNLAFIRKMLLKPFAPEDGSYGLIDFLRGYDSKGKKYKRIPQDALAAEAVGMLAEIIGSDEAGSFKTTLSKNWKWLSEPQMQKQVSGADVSIKRTVQTGGSVYIVVPPNRIDDFKNWIRIILQICFDAKIELGDDQQTQETLFLIDEFPLLGKIKEVEKGAGFLRGYNCKLVVAIQNIGQIRILYGGNWETFLGNAGAIIGFATNDHATEEYLSNRMGKILAWETSFSVNSGASAQALGGGGMSTGKTTTQGQRERPVRMPNEIHAQGARTTMRGFVIPADGKPFMVLRQNYDAIKTDVPIFDTREDIRAWEKAYGGELQ